MSTFGISGILIIAIASLLATVAIGIGLFFLIRYLIRRSDASEARRRHDSEIKKMNIKDL